MVAMSDVGVDEMPEPATAAGQPWNTATVAVLSVVIAAPLVLLIALLLGLTGLLGWLWAVLVGLVIGAAVAAFVVVRRLSSAAEVVLAALPPDVRRYDRLDNLVDGLRLTAGVLPPSVHIIDDPAANAMAVSRNLEHTLVMTTGLVDNLDLVPLEGVVAELMVRLRSGEAERDTMSVALGRIPLVNVPVLGSLTRAAASWADRLGDSEVDPENDDILADYRAVMLTRYPPGLRAALEDVRSVGTRPAARSELDSLWFVDPAAGDNSAGSERPSLELRIDALAEL